MSSLYNHFTICQVNAVNGYRDSYHPHLTNFEKLIKIAGIPEFNIKEHFNVLKKVYRGFQIGGWEQKFIHIFGGINYRGISEHF